MVTSTGAGVWTSVVGAVDIEDDVIINHAVTLDAAVDMTGDLTINASKTLNTTATDYNLTVTGDVNVSGTLTTNASPISFGALTFGGIYNGTTHADGTIITGPVDASWLFQQRPSGTFNTNSGLVHINAGSNAGHIRGNFHHLKSTMNTTSRIIWRDVSGNTMTVGGDLTIVEGRMDRDSLTDTLTVTGDVSIESGGSIGYQQGGSAETGPNTFGSLTIASGGTYSATSGTTTITDVSGSNYAMYNDGTFTHNKGTIKFKTDTDGITWYMFNSTNRTGIVLYNLEVELTGSAGNYRSWAGGTNRYINVENNLIIGAGTKLYSSNSSGYLYVNGNVQIDGQLEIDNVPNVYIDGVVTIGAAGLLDFNNGDQTINVGGIRNLRGSAGIEA